MDEKSLNVIQESIRHTMSLMRLLACENYPYTEFKDRDIGRMYYELNVMSICISNKLDAAGKKAG